MPTCINIGVFILILGKSSCCWLLTHQPVKTFAAYNPPRGRPFSIQLPLPTRPQPTLIHPGNTEAKEMRQQHSTRGGHGGSRGTGQLLPAADGRVHPAPSPNCSTSPAPTTAAAEDQWQPWLVSIRRAAAGLGACRLLGISGRQRAPVQGGPRRRISEPPCS